MLMSNWATGIGSFNWEKLFEGKNVRDQAYLFNEIILKIFSSFIPNKIITCSDKGPAWFNDEIRQFLNKRDEIFFKRFINRGKLQSDYDGLQFIRSDLVESIRSSKEKFNVRSSTKLSDPSTTAKTYWWILKTFVNGKNVPLLVIS